MNTIVPPRDFVVLSKQEIGDAIGDAMRKKIGPSCFVGIIHFRGFGIADAHERGEVVVDEAHALVKLFPTHHPAGEPT